jgi:anaerobic selenocysteine-containing dehydrogenase
VSDEELARQALRPVGGPNGYPPKRAFAGVTLEHLLEGGPARLDLPTEYAPFAEGGFGTPSGKCELYSPSLAARGLDPLPNYTPPHEDPQTRPDLAAKYPLQMVCPPAPSFMNSTFVNQDPQRRSAGEVTVELHPTDAAQRGIAHGQAVRVFNGRGSFRAKALVGETVRPGVAVTLGVWWRRYTADGVNSNCTTATALTDFGGGATFFDNLVEVEALPAGA